MIRKKTIWAKYKESAFIKFHTNGKAEGATLVDRGFAGFLQSLGRDEEPPINFVFFLHVIVHRVWMVVMGANFISILVEDR